MKFEPITFQSYNTDTDKCTGNNELEGLELVRTGIRRGTGRFARFFFSDKRDRIRDNGVVVTNRICLSHTGNRFKNDKTYCQSSCHIIEFHKLYIYLAKVGDDFVGILSYLGRRALYFRVHFLSDMSYGEALRGGGFRYRTRCSSEKVYIFPFWAYCVRKSRAFCFTDTDLRFQNEGVSLRDRHELRPVEALTLSH